MNRFTATAAILLLACVRHGYAKEGSGDLKLNISSLENSSGQVVANLFCTGQDVLKIEDACRRVHTTISGKHAELVFHNLPYGTYAVSVFHDENNNGTLDHNILHLPAEPLGFSNGFRLGLFSGFPSFQKLQFAFAQKTRELDIELR